MIEIKVYPFHKPKLKHIHNIFISYSCQMTSIYYICTLTGLVASVLSTNEKIVEEHHEYVTILSSNNVNVLFKLHCKYYAGK